MGRCLICLFYWGTVLNIYFRIPDGRLASLFWASSSNTPSSVYHGLLGDYCSAVISPTLWSEEHQGTSSGAGIGCCLCQDVHDQDSAPQLEVSFVQYYHAQTGLFCLVLPYADWLALFQINLLQNECVNSLFYSFDSRLV